MAGAGHIVVLSGILLGKADVELAVEHLHIERRIARRNARVGDGLHQFEGRVVDLDRAGAEIGGVEQALIRGDRKPLIDRARRGGWYCGFIDGDNRMSSIDGRAPSRNRPALGREDEGRRPGLEIWVRRRQAVRDIEAGGATSLRTWPVGVAVPGVWPGGVAIVTTSPCFTPAPL